MIIAAGGGKTEAAVFFPPIWCRNALLFPPLFWTSNQKYRRVAAWITPQLCLRANREFGARVSRLLLTLQGWLPSAGTVPKSPVLLSDGINDGDCVFQRLSRDDWSVLQTSPEEENAPGECFYCANVPVYPADSVVFLCCFMLLYLWHGGLVGHGSNPGQTQSLHVLHVTTLGFICFSMTVFDSFNKVQLWLVAVVCFEYQS